MLALGRLFDEDSQDPEVLNVNIEPKPFVQKTSSVSKRLTDHDDLSYPTERNAARRKENSARQSRSPVEHSQSLHVKSLSSVQLNYEFMCRLCGNAYDSEDQKVFTLCCGVPVGSQCKIDHYEEFGECWECGQDEDMDHDKLSTAPSEVLNYKRHFVEEQLPALPSAQGPAATTTPSQVLSNATAETPEPGAPKGSPDGSLFTANESSQTRFRVSPAESENPVSEPWHDGIWPPLDSTPGGIEAEPFDVLADAIHDLRDLYAVFKDRIKDEEKDNMIQEIHDIFGSKSCSYLRLSI